MKEPAWLLSSIDEKKVLYPVWSLSIRTEVLLVVRSGLAVEAGS
jgi:hypothetical protein